MNIHDPATLEAVWLLATWLWFASLLMLAFGQRRLNTFAVSLIGSGLVALGLMIWLIFS